MAGEAIKVPSAWVSILAGASVGAGSVSGESSSVDASALSANEKLYELNDFELIVTGSPAADGNTVDLYRRAKGNTGAGPVPTVSYSYDYVDSFVLKAGQAGSYYVYGFANGDPKDTYYVKNGDTGALTLALSTRTRTSGPAV